MWERFRAVEHPRRSASKNRRGRSSPCSRRSRRSTLPVDTSTFYIDDATGVVILPAAARAFHDVGPGHPGNAGSEVALATRREIPDEVYASEAIAKPKRRRFNCGSLLDKSGRSVVGEGVMPSQSAAACRGAVRLARVQVSRVPSEHHDQFRGGDRFPVAGEGLS